MVNPTAMRYNRRFVFLSSTNDPAMSPDFVNRIHQGDCIAGMNGLPEGCVDLAFADPPFNIGYKYDVYDDRREARALSRLVAAVDRGGPSRAQAERHVLAGDRRRVSRPS